VVSSNPQIVINNYGLGEEQMAAIMEQFEMVRAEIQALLDRAKQSADLIQSVHSGMDALRAQNKELQAKIDSMVPGDALSQEDKDALAETASLQDSLIKQLRDDIPQNVDTGNAGGSSSEGQSPQGGQSSSGGQTSGGEQSSGGASGEQSSGNAPQEQSSQQSSGAEGGPQPLPGTGQ